MIWAVIKENYFSSWKVITAFPEEELQGRQWRSLPRFHWQTWQGAERSAPSFANTCSGEDTGRSRPQRPTDPGDTKPDDTHVGEVSSPSPDCKPQLSNGFLHLQPVSLLRTVSLKTLRHCPKHRRITHFPGPAPHLEALGGVAGATWE